MCGVHHLLRAKSEHRTRIALATSLLFVDSKCDRRRRASHGENGAWLGKSDNSFLGANTDAPFLSDPADEPQTSKDKVKQAAQHDCQDWTKQEGKHKALAERAEIHSRSHGAEPTSHDGAGDAVGGGDRKSQERGEDDRNSHTE